MFTKLSLSIFLAVNGLAACGPDHSSYLGEQKIEDETARKTFNAQYYHITQIPVKGSAHDPFKETGEIRGSIEDDDKYETVYLNKFAGYDKKYLKGGLGLSAKKDGVIAQSEFVPITLKFDGKWKFSQYKPTRAPTIVTGNTTATIVHKPTGIAIGETRLLSLRNKNASRLLDDDDREKQKKSFIEYAERNFKGWGFTDSYYSVTDGRIYVCAGDRYNDVCEASIVSRVLPGGVIHKTLHIKILKKSQNAK